MSVYKRKDSYAVTVYDPSTKAKRWVGTYPTMRLARAAEASAILERRSGAELVAGYASRWLELHPRKKRSTEIHYQDRLAPFVRDFGHRRLADIDRVEAREWVIAHRSCHAPVRAMYSDAVRDGVVQVNPFADMRLQQSRGRRDLEVLSVEEIQRAADIAREKFGPGISALILTAAYVGMRPGELYALRWPAINFAEREIDVTSTYSSRSKETTSPKNDKHRRIVLFSEARDALLRVPREDGTVVFRTIKGRPLTGATLHYYWDPIRTAIGKPGESFYALRHFCASHLLNTLGHEVEDVAYQLGHTDGGVLIQRLYGHPSESLARQRLKAGVGRKARPLRDISVATGKRSA